MSKVITNINPPATRIDQSIRMCTCTASLPGYGCAKGSINNTGSPGPGNETPGKMAIVFLFFIYHAFYQVHVLPCFSSLY